MIFGLKVPVVFSPLKRILRIIPTTIKQKTPATIHDLVGPSNHICISLFLCWDVDLIFSQGIAIMLDYIIDRNKHSQTKDVQTEKTTSKKSIVSLSLFFYSVKLKLKMFLINPKRFITNGHSFIFYFNIS